MVVKGTELQLFYYDATRGNLRHAFINDTRGWYFETFDGEAASLGHDASDVGRFVTATAFDGGYQVFYYDTGSGNLRHAWTTATGGWYFENLDGDAGSIAGYTADVGRYPTVIAQGSTLRVFSYDATNGNRRHAWITPTGGWYFENLDGDPGSISHYSSDVY